MNATVATRACVSAFAPDPSTNRFGFVDAVARCVGLGGRGRRGDMVSF